MGVLTEINRHLLNRNTWPPRNVAGLWEEIELFAALRTSDDTRLRQEASVNWRYPYVKSPLPRMISRASTNLLFGEPPSFAPGSEDDADADRLDFIVTENDLPAELQRGGLMTSSEGDVFGRVLVQPSVLDAPIIEFVSRARVIPHFSGRFLLGATFITEWQEGRNDFFRLFETYEPGAVVSVLYRGTRTSVGGEYPLDGYSRTEGVQPVVYTGVERPLCTFIPNSVDADPTRGHSDYRGLEDRFLAVNEAVSIGQSNLRLAGRKRAIVDAAYLDENGRLNRDDDLLLRKDRGGSIDGKNKPLEVLEYSFEGEALQAWVDHMIDSTLVLSGTAPTLVGRSVDGGAISGTALRLKAAHSLIEAAGKGRHFVRGVSWLLRAAAIIDSRPTTQGGFGRRWNDADVAPKIELQDGMPVDEREQAEMLVMLTNAEAISLEEKIKLRRPEWTQQQVDDEIERIGVVGEPAPPATLGGSLTPPRPPLSLPPAE